MAPASGLRRHACRLRFGCSRPLAAALNAQLTSIMMETPTTIPTSRFRRSMFAGGPQATIEQKGDAHLGPDIGMDGAQVRARTAERRILGDDVVVLHNNRDRLPTADRATTPLE